MRISLGVLVYVGIGCVIAAQRNFFDHLGTIDGIASAALAVLLWPLVLLGIHAKI